MKKAVGFDLEGPLSPADFAFEAMGLVNIRIDGQECSGRDVFEVISRWDDFLTEDKEARVPGHIPDYEPGDTLSWIVPHLIYHGITENELKTLSDKTGIVDGAQETIQSLQQSGVLVGIISTSYEQHAKSIASRLGVDFENVFCTPFPLAAFRSQLQDKDLSIIGKFEEETLKNLHPIEGKDEEIRKVLNRFYLQELPSLGIWPRETVRVNGGTRKVEKVMSLAEKAEVPLSEMIVVGDSITDINMLQIVKERGGLAVAFNANRYALEKANVALATTDMRDSLFLFDAFWRGGLDGVKNFVRSKEKVSITAGKERPLTSDFSERGNYYWIEDGKGLDSILETHARIRKIVRGQAAKLG